MNPTNLIDFLTRYQCVIYMALCCFIPLLKPRGGLPLFLGLGTVYCAIPYVYTSVTEIAFWYHPIFSLTDGYTVSYLLYWLLALALFYICFDCSVRNVLFYGAAAYSVQWFAANAQTIQRYLLFHGQRPFLENVVSLLTVTAVLVGFSFVFVRRLQNSEGVGLNNLQLTVFLISTLFCVNIFTQYWQRSYISAGDIDTIEIYGTVFSLIIALLLLIVQFGLFEQTRLRRANALMEQMLKDAGKQYNLSKQTIEAINRKCHDMRYQIRALEAVTDEEQRRTLLRETEQAIRIYDGISKTGNEALDVILTEKALLCKENRITFNYILRGKDFSFMDAVDIYSLFGNALDNAIESLTRCADEEKRIITMREQSKGNFVNLTIENYCSEALEFSDGLPATTKPDKENHGFGTRSIRYIVEKYGGAVTMEREQERFIVRAYFIMPT